MKKRIKIFLNVLVILFVTFIINKVSAVGNISQAWIENSKGKRELVFRTFTTPYPTEVDNYKQQTGESLVYEDGKQWTYSRNGTNNSKWVADSSSYNYPNEYTFGTVGFAFHKVPMNSYKTEDASPGKNVGYMSSSKRITNKINSIKTVYDDAKPVYTKPVNNLSAPSDNIYYESWKVNPVLEARSWGTGLIANSFIGGTNKGLRHCIISIDSYWVYIEDNVIKGDDLTNLLDKYNSSGMASEGYSYVSNVITSKSYKEGYEIAYTAQKFFSQYDKYNNNGTPYYAGYWSNSTRGHAANSKSTTKAQGSILNLYDNIIYFPQMSTREVYVRHINIGNNTIINKSIVDNGTRIRKARTPFLTLSNGNVHTGDYSKEESYQEYFNGIPIDQGFDIDALENTATYRCLGYNMGIGSSLTQAQNSVDQSINAGTYTNASTVSVPGKSVTSESDVIVIDFYYTEYERDVYVNHIFVNKDNYVREKTYQTIIPNSYALEDGTTAISRVNTDKYIKEVYKKRLSHSVKVRKADSLSDLPDNIEYRGYEVLDEKTNLSSIIGTQRVYKEGNTVTINKKNQVQVNFYYYYENRIEEEEPDKDINGKVFVKNAKEDETKTSCLDDETSKPILSIPSGTDATVGIKGIPRYMIAAVTTHYESPNEKKQINMLLSYKYGNETKTIDFPELYYKVGYFTITDMAMYKLKQMTIYDANNKDNMSTIGSKLFNWKNGKLDLSPNAMNLGIEMKGINDKTIKNNNISNIDNYVSIGLVDKLGSSMLINPSLASNVSATVTLLTTDEIKKVDADGNNVINNNDKTFAKDKLKLLKDALDHATEIKNQKQSQYEAKVAELNTLKAKYDAATNVLNNKKTAKNNAYKKWQDDKSKYDNYVENTVNIADQKLKDLNNDLLDLNKVKTEKEKDRDDYRKELNELEIVKTQLFNEKEALLQERNNLKELANCVDSVEENVYIYLEQSEKEQLEQCKLNKQLYEQNLEEKLLESKEEEYNSFLDNEYSQAVTDLSNIEDEIVEINNQINNKKSEISDQELLMITINTMKFTLLNNVQESNDNYNKLNTEYESYEQNEYNTAKNNYDNYVSGKFVENANKDLDNAIKDEQEAKKPYDDYKEYKETLDSLYPEYKEKYDLYKGINEASSAKNVANYLGLKISINVQNMIVNIVNSKTNIKTPLANASSNAASYENSLSNYMSLGEVPQVKTEKPIISKDVYSNIGSTLLEENDYSNKNFINKAIMNGVRALAGKAEYEIETMIGTKSDVTKIVDTVYYSDQTKIDEDAVHVFHLKNNSLIKTYKVDTSITIDKNNNKTVSSDRYKETEPINIYTPISVSAELKSNSSQLVDQSVSEINKEELQILQINTPFTIELKNNNKVSGYSNLQNTFKYSDGYYVKFDFDVHKVKINGKLYKNGVKIPAGTWIGLINKRSNEKLSYLEAQAYGNTEDDKVDVITEEKHSYTVRSVAYNATSTMKYRSINFESLGSMAKEMKELANICANPSYFAEETYDVVILNRAFDFRVTDVKDVNWKNVFRRSSNNNTNVHTGMVYYSGTTKWNTKSERSNEIISRTVSEIGRNPLRTLPIGPYKNSNSTYIKAPKIGYRFSFDMKVTGSYYNSKGKADTNKSVIIDTRFYYLSKDGNTFLKEYDSSTKVKGIYLFYKKSDGSYVRIDQNGGNYELSFIPNDGYRLIQDYDKSNLSKKQVTLGNLRSIILTSSMATPANNGSYITYYGDYKLPNSTIAVEVDENGKYDINKPLKNGYIGVIFDIAIYAGKINDSTTMLLSYSKNTNKDLPNSSQWDYEGYLGYTKTSKALTTDNKIKLKLENGNYVIDTDSKYNDIKGTVILYDTDERAATDFD